MKEFLHSFRGWINEDSRSSIMGTLGLSSSAAMHAIWAAKKLGVEEHAFLLLKFYYLRMLHYYKNEGGGEEKPSAKAVKKSVRWHIDYHAGGTKHTIGHDDETLERTLLSWYGEQGPWVMRDALAILKSAPKKYHKRLRSAGTWKTLTSAVETAMEDIEKEEQEKLRAKIREDIMIVFPDGFFWYNVTCTVAQSTEGRVMQHCGRPSEGGTMASLRDEHNNPHVTIDWNKETMKVHRCRGKQHELPHEKYWKYIYQFVDEVGIKIFDERGQKMSDPDTPLDDSLYDAVHANSNIPTPPLPS